MNVLLLRHVFQGSFSFFCLINITDIQRKHSPWRCAKQRVTGKQVHSHLLLASSATGWPSARDTDTCFFFFFLTVPNAQTNNKLSSLHLFFSAKKKEKRNFPHTKRPALYFLKPSVGQLYSLLSSPSWSN